jgi:hypothetical protein
LSLLGGDGLRGQHRCRRGRLTGTDTSAGGPASTAGGPTASRRRLRYDGSWCRSQRRRGGDVRGRSRCWFDRRSRCDCRCRCHGSGRGRER